MAKLFDAFGRPVDTGQLLEEQAGPTLTGVRSTMQTHPGRGLTPERLASILLQAEEADPADFFALAEDMEEREIHYFAQLGTRKRAVSQLELHVEAASDSAEHVRAADLVRDWLRSGGMTGAMFDTLDGIGKGVSVLEVDWDRSGREWFPRALVHRPAGWFTFDRLTGRTLLVRDDGGTRPLLPYRFLVHTHKSKSGLPVRGGLARVAAWSYLFKLYALKDWVSFAELFGKPYRLGRYESTATPAERMTLLRAVSQIGTDAAAIVPKGMEIEFKEAARAGSISTFSGLVEYLDSQVSLAVLGQTLTSKVSSAGGSRALGEVHDNVRRDIMGDDAAQVEVSINRDLVRPLVDLNLGPQKLYPRLKVGLPDRLSSQERLKIIREFVPLGLRVEESMVRDLVGFPDPAADAVLLQSPARKTAPGRAEDAPAAQSAGPAARSANASEAAPAGSDPAGELARAALEDSGWEPIMRPVLEPLAELLEDAESLEDARDRLADLVLQMDLGTVRELLARNAFAARLAGEVADPVGAG